MDAPGPSFGAEQAVKVLSSLKLTGVVIQDYLVVMSTDLDYFVVSDEPHVVLMLFYSVRTGDFFVRMWSKTVGVGRVRDLDQFYDVCDRHFKRRRLCLGCPFSDEEEKPYIVSHTPFPRKIARTCNGFISEHRGANTTSCTACHDLSDCEMDTREGEDAVVPIDNALDMVEVTIKEEPIEDNKERNIPPVEGQVREDMFEGIVVEHSAGNETQPEIQKGNEIQHEVKHGEGEGKQKVKKKLTSQASIASFSYQCNECGERFKELKDFRNHTYEHTVFGIKRNPDQTYLQVQSDLKELDTQLETSQDGGKPYIPCLYCDKVFKNHASHYYHRKSEHKWGQFRCGQCNKKYHFAKELVKHVNEFQECQDHYYKFCQKQPCPLCNALITLADLEQHYVQCIDAAMGQSRKLTVQKRTATESGHEMKENLTTSVDENDLKNEVKPFQYQIQNGSKIWPCQYCDKICRNQTTLLYHKKTIHNYGPFRCAMCNKKCHIAQELAKHVGEVQQCQSHYSLHLNHTASCPSCKKDNIPLADLEQHYAECINANYANKRKISKQKSTITELPCQYCERIFTSYVTLTYHRRKEHNWGKFECKACLQIFNFVKDLAQHFELTQHCQDGESKCPSCKEQVPVEGLEQHYEMCYDVKRKEESRRMHRKANKRDMEEAKVLCEFCESTFNTRQAYYMHRRLKHFWVPFRCPNCDELHHFARDLVQHMQTAGHTSAVKCPSCQGQVETAELEKGQFT